MNDEELWLRRIAKRHKAVKDDKFKGWFVQEIEGIGIINPRAMGHRLIDLGDGILFYADEEIIP